MKWTATFDADRNVTLTPDTPETRADLARTLADLHTGRLEIERVEFLPPE
jgi:hypothetical protein